MNISTSNNRRASSHLRRRVIPAVAAFLAVLYGLPHTTDAQASEGVQVPAVSSLQPTGYCGQGFELHVAFYRAMYLDQTYASSACTRPSAGAANGVGKRAVAVHAAGSWPSFPDIDPELSRSTTVR